MHEQVLCLCHIMNIPISDYQQYRIHIRLCLTSSHYIQLLLYDGPEICGPTEWYRGQCAFIELHHIQSPLYFGEGRHAVKWETVVDLGRSHVPGDASKAVHGEGSVVVVHLQDWAHWVDGSFVLVLSLKGMEGGRFKGFSVRSCIVDGYTDVNLHSTF